MTSKKQVEYLSLYLSGLTMEEISTRFSVNKSTVSRVIKRARRCVCPFSTDCTKCSLPDCAIKDEYAFMVNNTEDARCSDKRGTKRHT